MSVLTLSSRVSFTALPLCDQVNIGSGKPETSHSNFIFCPALAITLERGTINAGDSVGSNAVKGVNFKFFYIHFPYFKVFIHLFILSLLILIDGIKIELNQCEMNMVRLSK